MGVTWQTPDQKLFIEESLPGFVQHFTAGTVKAIFWPEFFEEWFVRWPLPEPTPDLIEKKGNVEKATKAARKKQVDVSISRHRLLH